MIRKSKKRNRSSSWSWCRRSNFSGSTDKFSVAKGLNLKNATNLPNHAKNHATKKTLKRSHIFGQRRHNFDQLKIFSIAFFSQKIRNCHDLGKRRHNLSWRRHKSDILNQIIKRRHIFELWRVHATSNFMAPQGGPKTPLWRDHATFGNTVWHLWDVCYPNKNVIYFDIISFDVVC